MALGRGFILKGIAGLATLVGAAGGGTIYFRHKNASQNEKKDEKENSSKVSQEVSTQEQPPAKPSVDQTEEKDSTQNTPKKPEATTPKEPTEDNLGIPKDCKSEEVKDSNASKECDLTEEQFKKIKFSTKTNSSIEITGITETNKVNLKIEYEEDNTPYPNNRKYTLKSKNETITIKGMVDGDVELTKDKEVKFREVSSKNKLERVPEPKEDNLGIPLSCQADQVTASNTPKECALTKDQLKKVKFKDLQGSKGPITLNVLGKDKTITLKIEHTNEEGYINNRKYTFDNTNNADITIKDSDNKSLTLNKQTEHYYKEESGVLTLVSSKSKSEIKKEAKMKEVNDTLSKLGIEGLNLDVGSFANNGTKFNKKEIDLDEEALKKIQFKELNGAAATISGMGNSKKIKLGLHWSDDLTKFPKNMKFTFTNSNSEEVELKDASGKGMKIGKGGQDREFKVEDDKWLVKNVKSVRIR